jgi:hypothetical protein
MNDSQRKPWSQPKLLVLVRGTSDEHVLANCKGDGTVSSNTRHNSGCHRGAGCLSTCAAIGS